MDIEKKIELVCRKPTQEVITVDELRGVFQNYSHPRHYIGFEISGLAHIGTGLMTTLKIKDMLAAGVKPTIFLADYHSYINGKLGGDLDFIRKTAKGYFKAVFNSMGLEDSKVDFVLASEIYDNDYWASVLSISKSTTIARMLRCTAIMGRTQKEAVYSSAILYPAMQAADIFALDVQIAQSGMDQRKVHMLAREVAPKIGKKPPVAVHGHLVMGLQGPAKMGIEQSQTIRLPNPSGRGGIEITKTTTTLPADFDEDEEMLAGKMSKSKPETALYVHDSEETIRSKIAKAYCPVGVVDGNPIIELAEYVILRDGTTPMAITRPAKFGGDLVIESSDMLRLLYSQGKIHPLDLKNAVASHISNMLKPCRDYFALHPELMEPLKNPSAITR
ncbi:MAG: tyrosine--tRNA ligase [Candidatus Micrarchaeia archaeon]